MELITTYPAAVNSKATVTMGVLDQGTTIVEVLDATVLPEAPNLLVLGTDQTAETVLMTARENNTLTIQRAVQGIAKSWPAGTQIARNFTGKDWDDMRSNVEALFNELVSLIVDGVVPVDKGGTGADNVFGAARNIYALHWIGYNPLSSVDEDTVLRWCQIGSGFCFITEQGILDKQPGQYLMLQNFISGYESQKAVDIFQIASSQTSGEIYFRQGNNAGWLTNWIELADASKFLPLTGGTLSGNLTISKVFPELLLRYTDLENFLDLFMASDGWLYLQNRTDGNNNQSIIVKKQSDSIDEAVKLYRRVNRTANSYSLFGEHNKPSGSYTGNGSATSRTIQTGGLGDAVLVISKTKSTSLIVTPSGAFGKTGGSIGYFGYDTAHFENKILTIASTDVALNANTVTYTYRVL